MNLNTGVSPGAISYMKTKNMDLTSSSDARNPVPINRKIGARLTPIFNMKTKNTIIATSLLIIFTFASAWSAAGAPGASAAHSTISPGATNITADGISTQLITVQARDASSNVVTNGDSVVVITLLSGTGTAGPLTATYTGTNGNYTNSVTSTATPGRGIFMATLGGVPVGTSVGASNSVVSYIGPVAQLRFVKPDGSTNDIWGNTYGRGLSQQPVVRTYDVFTNASTVGLAPSLMVSLALTNPVMGVLQGTTNLDIGTAAGNGVVSFTNLSINAAWDFDYVRATAPGLASIVSEPKFAINQAPLTITALDQSKVFGTTMTFPTNSTAFSVGALQMAYNETIGTVTLNCAGGLATAPAGSYVITNGAAAGGTFSATNYLITYVNGTLNVGKATLTITTANGSREYGDENTGLTGTYTGQQGSDTFIVTGTCPTATNSSPLGNYVIVGHVAAVPPASLTNYTVVTNNTGLLSVNPALLTITATATNRFYGSTNPAFTGTYTGNKLGSNFTLSGSCPTGLTNSPATYTNGSPVVTNNLYAIIPSVVDGPDKWQTNYTVITVTNYLTVNPAPLTIAAYNTNRIYGDLNPNPFLGTNSGAVNGETFTVTGTCPSATTNSPATAFGACVTNPVGGAPVTNSSEWAGMRFVVGANPVTVTELGRMMAPGNTGTHSLILVRHSDSNTIATASVTMSGGTVGQFKYVTLSSPVTLPAGSTNSLMSEETAGGDMWYDMVSVTATPVVSVVGIAYGWPGDWRWWDMPNTQSGPVNFKYALNYYPILPSVASGPPSWQINYQVIPATNYLTVDKAELVLGANNASREKGYANPPFVAWYQQNKNGESFTVTPSCPTAPDKSTNVGSYLINLAVTGATLDNYYTNNWGVDPEAAYLYVTKGTATVTVNAATRQYGTGTNYQVFTATTNGVVPGDTLKITIVSPATRATPVGPPVGTPPGTFVSPYFITVDTSSETVYTVTVVTNTLTVTPAPALIAANNTNRAYGVTNPVLSATVTVTGTNGLSTEPATAPLLYGLFTTAATNSVSGYYQIIVNVTNGVNTNYTVTTTEGTLTVAKYAGWITASNQYRAYGDTNPVLTAAIGGLSGGDTNFNYTLSTAATNITGVGSNLIVVTLGSNPNYSMNTSTNGYLFVTNAPAWVTANLTNRFYGDTNPVLTAVTNGTKNGDTLNVYLKTEANIYSPVVPTGYPIQVLLTNDQPYVTSAVGGAPYTNLSAWVGMRFVVGANPVTITRLGRMMNTGNTGTHNLKLVNASNQVDILNTSVTMSGGTVGQFKYVTLSSPVTLPAGSTNDLMTQETAGGDIWYDGASVIGTPVASILGVAWGYSAPWLFHGPTNTAAGPVNFQYFQSQDIAANPNYLLLRTNNTLWVTNAPLAVAVNATNRVYGDPNPPFTGTITGGLKNGDTFTVTGSTTATTTSTATYTNVFGVITNRYPIEAIVAGATNYRVASTNWLTIDRAPLDITATDYGRAYGVDNPNFKGTYTGAKLLQEFEVTGTCPTASNTSPVGVYTIIPSVTESNTTPIGTLTNYNVISHNGTLRVGTVNATIVANLITRPYGTTNPPLTVTITPAGARLIYTTNTTADVNSPIGTNIYPITVTANPADNPYYIVTTTNSYLNVSQAALTIVAYNTNRLYGSTNPVFYGYASNAPAFTVMGRAVQTTNGPAVTNSPVTWGGTNTTFPWGTNNLYAIEPYLTNGPGLTNYTITTVVTGYLSVVRAPLNIAAYATNRPYGSANPLFTPLITGATNGDLFWLSLTTGATPTNSVGTYGIVPTLVDSSPSGVETNYLVTKTTNQLTVDKVNLSLVAYDQSRPYGTPNPTFTGAISGAVNNDKFGTNYTCLATPTSGVDFYPITPNVTNPVPAGALNNYNVLQTNGILTVFEKAATVYAIPFTNPYSADIPDLNGTNYWRTTGLVNSDTLVPGVDFTLTTTATSASPQGNYPISVNVSNRNPNYFVSGLNNTLTIGPATLTIWAYNTNRPYGDTNPVFGPDIANNYSGNKAGDTFTVTVSSLSYTNADINIVADGYGLRNLSPATYLFQPPGTNAAGQLTNTPYLTNIYAIVPQVDGLNKTNYNVVWTNNWLTVDKRVATCVADAKTRLYGSPNPTFTGVTNGFVPGGEAVAFTNVTVLSGTTNIYTVSSDSPVGPYQITAILVDSNRNFAPTLVYSNYSVTVSNATLTVGKANLIINAPLTTRFYGETNPVFFYYGTNATGNATGTNWANADFVARISGAVNGETNFTVTGACPATQFTMATNIASSLGGSPAIWTYTQTGVQTITPSVTGPTIGNYAVTANGGNFIIAKRPVDVLASPTNRLYGVNNPSFTTVTNKMAAGDPGQVKVTIGCTATSISGVGGGYPITVVSNAVPTRSPSNGPLVDPNTNYQVTAYGNILTIWGRPVGITANPTNRYYGRTNPVLTATVTGTNGAIGAIDPVVFTLGTWDTNFVGEARTNSPAGGGSVDGKYPIQVTAYQTNNPNYLLSTTNSLLTVAPAPLQIMANNYSPDKPYGQDVSAFFSSGKTNFTTIGLTNLETIGTVTLTCDGGVASAPVSGSPYPITPSAPIGGTFAATNYAITYPAGGTLVVTKLPLSITANNTNKTYGQKVTFAGTEFTTGAMVSGDSVTSVTLNSAGAATNANVIDAPYYPIVPTNAIGVGLGNYTIGYVNGSLSVIPAIATVVANPTNRPYGGTNYLSATVTGQTGGSNVIYTLATVATNTSPVGGGSGALGAYPITVICDPANNTNYSVTTTNGLLTVDARALTITASNQSKAYGQVLTFPVSGSSLFSASGLQNGETVGSVTLDSAGGVVTAPVASYAITPSAATGGTILATNYAVTYSTNGTLTVTGRPLSITANNTNKTYGNTLTFVGNEVTYVGLTNSDTVTSVALSSAGATNTASVGSFPITATNAVGSGLTNYTISYAPGTLAVSGRTLHITATDTNKLYGQTVTFTGKEFTPGVGELVNGNTVTSVALFSAGATNTASVGTNIITATNAVGTGLGNYSILYQDGKLIVNKTGLTIAANNASRVYGAANPAFTGTATGAAAGDVFTVAGTSPATPTSWVGGYAIVPSVTPAALLSNYTVTTNNGTLTVTQAGAWVTAEPKSRGYGDANPGLTALTGGTLFGDTLNYSLITTANTYSVVGGYPIQVVLTNEQTYVTSAVGGAPYNTFSAWVGMQFVVGANPVTITQLGRMMATNNTGTHNLKLVNASNQADILNTSVTMSGGTVGQFKYVTLSSPVTLPAGSTNYLMSEETAGGDIWYDVATVTTTPAASVLGIAWGWSAPWLINPAPNQESGPVNFKYAVNPNYLVTATNSTLTVSNAVLTITAGSGTRPYAAANPTFTWGYTGEKNGEGFTGTNTTAATTNSGVGSYPVTPSVAGATLGNYTRITNSGTLTVTPTSLTITALPQSKTYGQTLLFPISSTTAFSPSGLLNGDSVTSVTLDSAGGVAPASAGTYAITPSLAVGPRLTNYSPVAYVDGVLTVGKATLAVTAYATNRPYGDANPAFTGSLTGQQGGETFDVTYSSTATPTNQVTYFTNSLVTPSVITTNLYFIVPSVTGVTLGNYNVNKTNGALTVTPALLTVTAGNTNRLYGAANPTFTASYTGAKNGETFTNTVACSAATNSPVGTYPIVPTVAAVAPALLGNYAVLTNNGTLTVTPVTAVVVADAKSRLYGDVNPALTALVSGTVGADTLNYTLTTTATTNSGVASYPITVALGSNPNYTVFKFDSTLTVNARALTVTADAKTKLVGNADPALTYQITSGVLVNGNALSGALSRVAGETNGTYAILQGTLAATTNYVLTYIGANLVIVTPATPVVVSIVKSGANSVIVTCAGTPGASYQVRAATNIAPPVAWVSVSTNTAGTNGQWIYTDSSVNSRPQRFYRAYKP